MLAHTALCLSPFASGVCAMFEFKASTILKKPMAYCTTSLKTKWEPKQTAVVPAAPDGNKIEKKELANTMGSCYYQTEATIQI